MKPGDRMREARKRKHLTQKQLAKIINVTPQVISNWERGYTTSIPPQTIAILARVLDITPNYLLLADAMSEEPSALKPEINDDPYAVIIDMLKENDVPVEHVKEAALLLIKARKGR